jgi:anti-sigma B factor antagonist
MKGIDVGVTEKDGVVVVSVKGYIDTTTALEAEKALDAAVNAKKFKVVVDLSGVDYISSAGWGIFVGMKKVLKKNRGDIKLAGMKREVMEVYEVLDFTHVMEYFRDAQGAVESYGKKK